MTDTQKIRFGLVIVGDELLSGKRRDGHFDFMVNTLQQRGGQLDWARIVPDNIEQQTQAYRETRNTGAVVFSFGGIGATPDDLSRQSAAKAFEQPLLEHPQGIKLLRERFANDLNDYRRQLVHFPQGSQLIPNPINQVPGFYLEQHYFVPGFPNMAWPMVEWVLDTYYSHAFDGGADIEYLLHTQGVYESELIPMIESVLEQYPALKIACLPNSGQIGRVELGVKGQPELAGQGFRLLCLLLDQEKIAYQLPA